MLYDEFNDFGLANNSGPVYVFHELQKFPSRFLDSYQIALIISYTPPFGDALGYIFVVYNDHAPASQ